MHRKLVIAYIEITLAVLVWGASFIATKIALKDLSPVTVVWLRFAVGVVILGIAMLVRHQAILPSKMDLAYFSLLGFLGITFHQWLQSTGLVTSQASTTAWIVSTAPIFIAIMGWLFLHEKINGVQVSGILLAAFGVLLVVGKGSIRAVFGSHFGEPGDILILVSALNWAVFSILSRRGLLKYQATQMMFYVMALGWLFTSILFVTSGHMADILHFSWNSLLGIGFLGIFCSGFAYIAWYDALQAIPASQVGAFLYIEPLVAVTVAWLLLGETVSIITMAAGAIILIGVRMVQRA